MTRAQEWIAEHETVFSHRVGESAHALGIRCESHACPDIWQMENGDYIVIGTDVTAQFKEKLPSGVVCAPYERMVMIPSATLSSAAAHLSPSSCICSTSPDQREVPALVSS